MQMPRLPVGQDARLAAVQDPSVFLPAYYHQPFHGYDNGNLSWEAALELEPVARAVHASVLDPANAAVDPNGDTKMRSQFHEVAAGLMAAADAQNEGVVRSVVDLACGVGLSTVAAARAFPCADVLGTRRL